MPARSSSENALKIMRTNGGWHPKGDVSPPGGIGHGLPRGELARASPALRGRGAARPLNLQSQIHPANTKAAPLGGGKQPELPRKRCNGKAKRRVACLGCEGSRKPSAFGWAGPGNGTFGGFWVGVTCEWDWPPANPRSWGSVSLPGSRRLLYSFQLFSIKLSGCSEERWGGFLCSRARSRGLHAHLNQWLPVSRLLHPQREPGLVNKQFCFSRNYQTLTKRLTPNYFKLIKEVIIDFKASLKEIPLNPSLNTTIYFFFNQND